jgi:hypothetical protein
MADKEVVVNYEADEQDVMDEMEPEIELLDQDYVDDEPDESDDVTKQVQSPEDVEVSQRIAALKSQLEGGEAGTVSALKEVTETLRELRNQSQTKATDEAVEDLDVLRKKLADGFYDDPMSAVDTWIEKRLSRYEREKLQPAFNQMASVLRETTLDSSKRTATEDETGKFVMSKYADEVEQLVKSGQVQIGPGAYKKAVNQVASEHIDELLDWKIEQREAKRQADSADEVTRRPGKNASPRASGAPQSPNSKVQVSRAARDAIYAMADQKMLNREQFFESFVRKNPDKVRELNRRR